MGHTGRQQSADGAATAWRPIALLAVITLLLAVLPGTTLTAHAATMYYVNGDTQVSSDSNDCLSATSNGAGTGPCQSIQRAVNRASPGDTITIAGSDLSSGGGFDGVYCGEITLDISLTLQAQSAANPPAIDGGHGNDCAGALSGTVVTIGDNTNQPSISVALTNLTVQNGMGNGMYAGGILVYPHATLTFTNGSISNNLGSNSAHSRALGDGMSNEGTALLVNSTVSNNSPSACATSCTPDMGGGIYNSGTLTLINSTVTGNTSYWGGGIDNSAGTATLVNSTITANRAFAFLNLDGSSIAGRGGGIYNIGSVSLANTIVAGNQADLGSPDCSGSPSDYTPGGYNLIGDATNCFFLPGSADLVGGNGQPAINPKLGQLTNNGGPTETVAPAEGSQAIHAGSAAVCNLMTVSSGVPGPAGRDQRGAPRPTSSPCDIGAFDTLGRSPVSVSAAGNDITCTSQAVPCRHIGVGAAVASANATVTVAAGTYCEQIDLIRPVTIQGAAGTVVDGGNLAGSLCNQTEAPGKPVITVESSVALSSLTVEHGTNNPGSGGGISVTQTGRLTVTKSTIAGNIAYASGGGINNLGATTIVNSTVSGNLACAYNSCHGKGGGIAGSGTLDVVNSTMAGNAACSGTSCTGTGGGIVSAGTATVVSSTIAGNNACRGVSCSGTGGGIAQTGGTTGLTNTILAGNSDTQGQPDCSGTLGDARPNGSAAGNNLIGNVTGCNFAGGATDLIGGNGHPVMDAALGRLQFNGGPTETMALGTGSPALHAGNGTVCALTTLSDGSPGPAGLDQRGVLRPTAVPCDIGAFNTLSRMSVSVSPSGDDTACLSQAVACRHVAVGIAVADPAGTVTIAAGTYCEQLDVVTNVTLQGSGSAILDGSGNNSACAATTPPGQPVVTIEHEASPILSGLTIQNGAGTLFGAGIDVLAGAHLALTRSTVQNNVAGQAGGGIDSQGVVTITGSTIAGNTACSTSCPGQGGGIAATAGSLTLANSTLTANAACMSNSCTGDGGGIYTITQTTLINSTISGNEACSGFGCAGNGGGIAQSGGLTGLTNTIVAGNQANQGSPDCQGTLGDASPNGVTTGHNVIGDSSGCTFTAGIGDEVGGNGRPVIDPLLAPLANNGGPTRTMSLQPGSPAIGAGDVLTCSSSPIGNLDQRGAPRNTSSRHVCDIGAYDTGGSGATVALIRWFHVAPAGRQYIASWQMAGARSVLGFALRQGTHRLGRSLIRAQRRRITYRYVFQRQGSGPIALDVLLPGGTWLRGSAEVRLPGRR